MILKPAFADNLLSHFLYDFRLSSVTDIRGITLMIKGFVDELESVKIENLKKDTKIKT